MHISQSYIILVLPFSEYCRDNRTKYDVLPAIPIFNIASALGVPFVDKTVRVETLADAIVQCIEDEEVEGVQRYMQMEELAKRD